MTVRLAQDIGMPLIADYAKRFGVYDDLPPYLSFALGAGETTLLRMVTAYSMFDNGGKRVKPTLIDRIQDRYGHTIYRHDERECRGCDADKWRDQTEPTLVDRREQVLDPMTAYQITSMMEGVVQRGTAPRRLRRKWASRSPARPAPPTRPRTRGSSASRPISRSASISATTSRVHSARRATGGSSPRRS
jgi:membrane carboxypeptidase/penicillin-binding protein